MKTFLVPLTPEEETDCLCRLKNGEQGAKEELVLHNMRLVAHVAKKYVSSEEEQEDLISIGTIGLMKAVDSFRPEYGNKFATYAIRCVDNELLMHLRSKKKQRKEVSMFEPIGTDKEGNQIQLVDVLEFHDKNVADEVTKREQMKKICTFMNDVLSEREAFIIRRRYGIGGNQELTQREIARALGISRSYVSRIEKSARTCKATRCNLIGQLETGKADGVHQQSKGNDDIVANVLRYACSIFCNHLFFC